MPLLPIPAIHTTARTSWRILGAGPDTRDNLDNQQWAGQSGGDQPLPLSNPSGHGQTAVSSVLFSEQSSAKGLAFRASMESINTNGQSVGTKSGGLGSNFRSSIEALNSYNQEDDPRESNSSLQNKGGREMESVAASVNSLDPRESSSIQNTQKSQQLPPSEIASMNSAGSLVPFPAGKNCTVERFSSNLSLPEVKNSS